MPVSPAMAEDLARQVRDLYEASEHALLEHLARALAEGINSPQWAEVKLRSIGDLRAAVEDISTALQHDADGAIAAALTEAYGRGRQAAVAELGGLDIGRELHARRVLPNAPAVDRLAACMARDTRPLYVRITRAVTDAYRQIISRASAGVLLGAQTRREATQRALDQFAGRGITGFVDSAGRSWDMASYAEMAVRSVTARAAIEGHTDALAEIGVGLVIVSAAPLECPLCAPWEGEILSLNGPSGPHTVMEPHATDKGRLFGPRPMVPVHVVGSLMEARAAGLFHPNCFPGEVLVSAPSGVRAADSRWYEGDLVVIHTASGDELSVTPNHPVLTPEGWVPAGQLEVGGNVLRYRPGIERVDGVSPDDQQVPARISDVFDALRQASPVLPVHVPGAAKQFHGDGGAAQVEVVLADGLLRDSLDAETGQLAADGQLLVGGLRGGALLSEGSPFQVGLCSLHAADGIVGGGDLGASLLGRHALPLQPFRFTAGARDLGRFVSGVGVVDRGSVSAPQQGHADGGLRPSEASGDLGLRDALNVQGDGLVSPRGVSLLGDASRAELPVEGAAVDSDGGRDLARSLASEVSADRVVHVELRNFAGHVYNLQTGDGWYVAAGLVVHNCRHSLSAYLPGVTTRPESPPHPDGATYADTQQQRYLERQVRAWKRREAAAMDDKAKQKARASIREYQKRLRELTAEKGLPRRSHREQLLTGTP